MKLKNFYCEAFPLPEPPRLNFCKHASIQWSLRIRPSSRWLCVSQPSGTFHFAVCHAVRRGRPQSLPLSVSGDTPRPSSLRGPNGNSAARAAGLSERQAVSTVILMEYWISRGQRSCLRSKVSISFMSRQTADIWQQGEVKREAALGVIRLTFTIFLRLLYLRSPPPAPHFVS